MSQTSQHQQSGGGQQAAGNAQQAQLYPTQNYLAENVRVPIVELLNRTLADTTILMTHAKFAHWNVKGMEFYGLHQLFDELAETFEGHADEIGERVTALGGQAMGTAGMAVSNCSIPSMPSQAVTGQQFVEILADRLAVHDANLFEAIQTAQGYNDLDTADLLNEVSRDVTQQLWFLEAHLQTQPVGTVQASDQTQSVQTQLGQTQAGGGQQAGGGMQPVSGAQQSGAVEQQFGQPQMGQQQPQMGQAQPGQAQTGQAQPVGQPPGQVAQQSHPQPGQQPQGRAGQQSPGQMGQQSQSGQPFQGEQPGRQSQSGQSY